jgi:hypothetical protein
MIPHKSPIVLVACSVLVLGCSAGSGPTDGIVCTQEARAGITVDVRDSVTNALAGQGVRIVAREGAFADTVTSATFDGPFGLVFERAGTYTLSVDRPGYQSWSKAAVEVTKGTCHVNGVVVTARLQK